MSDIYAMAQKTVDLIETLCEKQGPLLINTKIYSRDIDSYSKDIKNFSTKKDLLTIGKKGKTITLQDVRKLIDRIDKQMEFLSENGFSYSYFFEGITYDEKNLTYNLLWGS